MLKRSRFRSADQKERIAALPPQGRTNLPRPCLQLSLKEEKLRCD